MGHLPRFVEFREMGPREGFQIEKRHYPLEDRVKIIDALSETGVKHIQMASFVSPKFVPSMADAEQLFASISRREGVHYEGLWFNRRGFDRALATPGAYITGKIGLYTSNEFCLKNNNCTDEEQRRGQLEMLDLYDSYGLPVEQASILTAFGCNLSGEVPISKVTDCVRFIKETCLSRGLELPIIYLVDTVGWANPDDIKRRVGAVREPMPDVRMGLHLHDTRGLGGANFYAGLEMGVDLFDSSVAGLGGCPFAAFKDPNGAGNVCTEDMVFMCEELGIETGIDLERMIEAARITESIIGRTLPGKIMHSGSLATFRKGRIDS